MRLCRDTLINPYWTAPHARNRGLAKRILNYMIADSDTTWTNCYAVVLYDNTTSIKCLESVGFKNIGFAKCKKWSYRLSSDKTNLIVFKYSRGE